MAFTIRKRESYRWTVEHALQKVGGKPDVITFDAEFKALPQKRIEELMARARVGEADDEAFFTEILVGWHGLEDGRGEQSEAFPYSPENRRLLLDLYPGIASSFSRAWVESVIGGGAARKN